MHLGKNSKFDLISIKFTRRLARLYTSYFKNKENSKELKLLHVKNYLENVPFYYFAYKSDVIVFLCDPPHLHLNL